MSQVSDNNTVAPAGPSRLSAALDVPPPSAQPAGGLSRETLVRAGVLGGLFVLLHLEPLRWLVLACWRDTDWNHGLILPLFSLYLLYIRRDDVLAAVRRPYWPGLLVMVGALAAEVFFATILPNNWLLNLSMIGMLFGLVLYLGGPALIRVTAVPILFLALAVPWPESLYGRVAYPLQEVAAKGTVGIMRGLGVDITRSASNLRLVTRSFQVHDLTVAEACSGMRLLMAFFTLGVATAYIESRPVWQRVVLVGAGIPIAVLCNVLRVTITSFTYYFDRPELGQDVMHNLTGMFMLLPAFAMLWGLSWLLKHLFVGEGEPARAQGGQS